MKISSESPHISADNQQRHALRTNTDERDQAVDANVGRCLGQVLSCVVVVWKTHRGGSVPRVYTERSDRPWVTLNLCMIRRYNLGEGDLASKIVEIKVVFSRVRTEPYPGCFPGYFPYRKFCKLCTTFIPVPGTCVRSVRTRHNTRGTGMPS